ncbi:ScyD/ScyE family protein [Granulicella arctica]|uniref:ScyD/ScyE family protein n=1 Tax=Granulicella arctica TaxID=940613 RepID=UPI0021DF85DD|nr:ScyD/ScyE family protein [Granulicella arctica]
MKALSRIGGLTSAALLLTLFAAPCRAQLTPTSATVSASGLNGPRGLVFGPDGTLYIAEAGTGGSNSTNGACAQVVGGPGPYLGGATATISQVDRTGTLSVLAKGLASSQNAGGDTFGIADLAFLNDSLYALVAGGGCSHGNPDLPNGIVKVNLKNGKWNYITDLSLFYIQHPAAYVDAPDFEADGVPYSMLSFKNALFTVEANHGQITRTAVSGSTTLVTDLSVSQGHIVPTGIAASGGNLYVGNLGLFPILTQRERVITLSKDLNFVDTTPGLETTPAEVSKFRVAASRAGFTTIVSLKFGPDGLLYALEISPNAGYPTPGAGEVVRLSRAGVIETVVSGLTLPTGMAFGPDNALYVSNFGDGPIGGGQVLRFMVP